MSEQMLPRHEVWRRLYRERRYCRHLTQSELNSRIRDIILNMLRITHEAKIGLLPIDKQDSHIWMEKWTHVLEEMVIRHGPYPLGFTRETLHFEPFPDFVSMLAQQAAALIKNLDATPGSVLLKLGQGQFMEALYKTGSLRVQPASFFRRKNLTGAVRDDEQRLALSFALSREDIVQLVINPQDVPLKIPNQRLDAQFICETDYFLYCVSEAIEARLFVDFAADACVVIRNKQEFIRRLHAAAIKQHPMGSFNHGKVKYIDPLLPQSTQIDVPFSKHFGYTYQQEYRFCWMPPKATEELQHIDLQLGSLTDISELITV